MKHLDLFLRIIIICCVVRIVEIQKNKIVENLKEKPKFYISQHIEEDFHPYVEDFLKDAVEYQLPKVVEERYFNLTIKYGIMPVSETKKIAGWCERQTRTIIIDRKFWNSFCINKRQALIDHELGHCLLDKPHRNAKTETEKGIAPYSIMFPDVVDGEFYANNKEYLRNELLGNRKTLNKFDETYALAETHRFLIPLFKDVNEFLTFIENYMNDDISEEEAKLIADKDDNNNT